MKSLLRNCDGCGATLETGEGVQLDATIVPLTAGAGEPYPRLQIDACSLPHVLLGLAKDVRSLSDAVVAQAVDTRDKATDAIASADASVADASTIADEADALAAVDDK